MTDLQFLMSINKWLRFIKKKQTSKEANFLDAAKYIVARVVSAGRGF